MRFGDRESAAVILTHQRPDDFRDCFTAIRPQVDWVIVVSHLSGYAETIAPAATHVYYDAVIPNISVAWNLGLTRAARNARGRPYDVAVLNDDVVVPERWFRDITSEMRRTGSVAGSAAQHNDPRMAGHAFILASEPGIYADERFEWWYGDDDIERRAVMHGGVVRVRGLNVEHRHPNSTTVGINEARAAKDAIRYREKWGL